MTFEAAGQAMSVLLACACVAVIVLAVVVFVRSRRAGAVVLFGRAVHRPGFWVSAMVCLGASGLLRTSRMEEVIPSSWQKPSGLIDIGLTLAFCVLLAIHLFIQQRIKRRAGR